MKYSLSPRKIPSAEPEGFLEGSGYFSIYPDSSHNTAAAAAVSYAEVTAVAVNKDPALAEELIAVVEAVLAVMLTCSYSL